MKKKNRKQKTVVLGLVVILLLAVLPVYTYADTFRPDQSGSISITGFSSGMRVNLYKVADITNMDMHNEILDFAITPAFAIAITEEDFNYGISLIGQKVASIVDGSEIPANASAIVSYDSAVKFSSLRPGVYCILSRGGNPLTVMLPQYDASYDSYVYDVTQKPKVSFGGMGLLSAGETKNIKAFSAVFADKTADAEVLLKVQSEDGKTDAVALADGQDSTQTIDHAVSLHDVSIEELPEGYKLASYDVVADTLLMVFAPDDGTNTIFMEPADAEEIEETSAAKAEIELSEQVLVSKASPADLVQSTQTALPGIAAGSVGLAAVLAGLLLLKRRTS